MTLTTMPYPGFSTDMQAQMMALIQGTSTIRETVFENRLIHVAEQAHMGVQIEVVDRVVRVHGQSHLSGAQVMTTGWRASACLILAGLAAQGKTVISRIYHPDRGNERIEEKLTVLGARVWREG